MVEDQEMKEGWKVSHIGGEKGMDLVSLLDKRTGFMVRTILANNGSRSEGVIAWSAGRYSRSAESAEGILQEIYGKSVDVVGKLDTFSKAYGHASLADMAQPMVYVENVPLYVEPGHFYRTRVNAGQGRSTRYQDFGQSALVDFWLFMPDGVDRADPKLKELQKEYQDVGRLGVKFYDKWRTKLTKAFTDFFKPNPKSKDELKALESRVFDSSRGFLLAGMLTSFADRASAREWARLISLGKGDRLSIDKCLAEQIEELLAPSEEIPGYVPEVDKLVRHTDINETTVSNIAKVNQFLQENYDPKLLNASVNNLAKRVEQSVRVAGEDIRIGEKLAVQYFLSCLPLLGYESAVRMVRSLGINKQVELSNLIFSGHSHRIVMSNQAEVTGLTGIFELTLAEGRDLIRQRGHGKLAPWFEIRKSYRQLFKTGFVLPLYLSEIPEFAALAQEYVVDMSRLYAQIGNFGETFDNYFGSQADDSLFLNLFPLNGAIQLIMHGDPKQEVYFPNLRTRNGGMINYRALAYEEARLMSQLDPLLSGLMLQSSPPDPASREEFFDRS